MTSGKDKACKSCGRRCGGKILTCANLPSVGFLCEDCLVRLVNAALSKSGSSFQCASCRVRKEGVGGVEIHGQWVCLDCLELGVVAARQSGFDVGSSSKREGPSVKDLADRMQYVEFVAKLRMFAERNLPGEMGKILEMQAFIGVEDYEVAGYVESHRAEIEKWCDDFILAPGSSSWRQRFSILVRGPQFDEGENEQE